MQFLRDSSGSLRRLGEGAYGQVQPQWHFQFYFWVAAGWPHVYRGMAGQQFIYVHVRSISQPCDSALKMHPPS